MSNIREEGDEFECNKLMNHGKNSGLCHYMCEVYV